VLQFDLATRLPDFTLRAALEVARETLVLIGPSGCGKSTLLSVLAGIRRADTGRIALDGQTLFDASAKIDRPPERRRIGYVLQQYALFPHLSVRDNITFGIRALSPQERARRMDDAIALLRIASLLDARPTEISGGERQRVAIARALVTEPQALVLDEPLAALDVEHRSRIRLELRAILERLDKPTIVVSHDYEDARVLGDRIAVMNAGEIVQVGTPAELLRHPASEFVARFCGTNLVDVMLGGVRVVAAFDPWRATLSRTPTGASHEFAGRVIDVARLGASLRVHVEGERSLFADVQVEEGVVAYNAGDVVYVSVVAADLRPQNAPSPHEVARVSQRIP